MKRTEFTNSVIDLVNDYISDFYEFDGNAQLRVNPALLLVEIENGYAFQEDIEYSDEAVEEAAAAHGDADESATDFQASQDFDYYPVKDFIDISSDGKGSVNMTAVDKLADKYFKKI
ncbi:MAG: hypothetical protein J1F20_08625 [Muribaculaceae bacterium]|nr:hypothetical protein [Muribaculaceae bacterium]